MSELVRMEAVRKSYRLGSVDVQALRDVELTIEAGEFTAIAGPSGSGKSTLFNLIGGLDRPSAGRIMVAGADLSTLSDSELSRLRTTKIGFVFQSYNLLPVLTARENVEYVLMLQGRSAAERREVALRTLDRVGLEGLERRFPRELSGGQQQRVAVARAIAAEPALILADEPTANLDSQTAAGLLDLMRGLNVERGMTFLFSTHDPAVIAAARRIVRLRDGVVASIEAPQSGARGHVLPDPLLTAASTG